MSGVNYIRSIQDLEMATYGLQGRAGNDLLKASGAVSGLHGSHSGVVSATATYSALYNKIYGQKVWSMINQEINPLSILSKRPYTQSGWRIQTARPSGGGDVRLATGGGTNASPHNDRLGGVNENHALATAGLTSVAPEYTTLFMSPKTVAHQFDYSEVAAAMAEIDDGIGDLRSVVREDMGKFHAEMMSKMIVTKLEVMTDGNHARTTDGVTTSVENNLTSLYKIVSNLQEARDMVAANLGSAFGNYTDSTGDITCSASGGADLLLKLYGVSRSGTTTNTFLDAKVSNGGGYGSGTARPLTLSILNSMIRDLRLEGASPKVLLTGYDTIQTMADLLQSQERFMDAKEVAPSVNGVKGVKGTEVGFRVATYYDLPLIPAKELTGTGESGATLLSDIFVLDPDHMWLAVLKPTQYFEDGINNGNPFGVGVLGNRGLYRTMGELGCSYFKGQGKITNLE